jgi:hypothetical protein
VLDADSSVRGHAGVKLPLFKDAAGQDLSVALHGAEGLYLMDAVGQLASVASVAFVDCEAAAAVR